MEDKTVMEWLLIFFLVSSHGGGVTTTRLATQEECQRIGRAIEENDFSRWAPRRYFICVEVAPLAKPKTKNPPAG